MLVAVDLSVQIQLQIKHVECMDDVSSESGQDLANATHENTRDGEIDEVKSRCKYTALIAYAKPLTAVREFGKSAESMHTIPSPWVRTIELIPTSWSHPITTRATLACTEFANILHAAARCSRRIGSCSIASRFGNGSGSVSSDLCNASPESSESITHIPGIIDSPCKSRLGWARVII